MDASWTDTVTIFGLGVTLSLALIVLIVARPQFAAYSYLAATPLIVGFARGDLIAILRPNEVLLLVILIALLLRVLIGMLAGGYKPMAFTPVDAAFLLLAATGSALPLLQRYARGLIISTDDVLYSIVLWKYFLLFRCCRASITTADQLHRCVWISLASGSAAGVIGLLQVTKLLSVPELLHTYFDQPFEGATSVITDRATSTLGSSFGLADVMIMNLVLALALLEQRQRPTWLIAASALLFVCGGVAAGEFSAFLGLAMALLAFAVVSGRLRMVAGIALPCIAVGCLAFWFVIEQRVAGFAQESSSLPVTWVGRWNNLQTFFFPELFSGLNWVWGVRPAPRVVAPETWRDWVYIESGYVWLLWIGGLPFLLAFGAFAWVSGCHLWRAARLRHDAVATFAAAGFAYLAVMVVLMLLDPHLTLRGSADLFFPILALSFAPNAPSAQRNHAASSGRRLARAQRESLPASSRDMPPSTAKRPAAANGSCREVFIHAHFA